MDRFKQLGGYDIDARIADVLKKLPRLKHGNENSPACSALRALDGFLGAAETGRYDPDLFSRAVDELKSAGMVYDSAVLLTRQRKPREALRNAHANFSLVRFKKSRASTPIAQLSSA